MTSEEDAEIFVNGWKASGIYNILDSNILLVHSRISLPFLQTIMMPHVGFLMQLMPCQKLKKVL